VRIATWNVNSVKQRLPRLLPWLDERQPDVVCLQETKLADDKLAELFGSELGDRGYAVAAHGEAAWNGVAILSRVGLDDVIAGLPGGPGFPHQEARAVAALNRSAGGKAYRLPHTGGMFYADGVTKIPAAAVAAEDAETIAHLAAQGEVKLKLVLTPQTLPDAESANVIADLKGSEKPDEIIIVSGHLDSWDLGTGAIDDAAGVGVAMQVANLVKQLKLQPKRTIRVVAWMNEENGGAGGRTYFQSIQANLAKHIAALECDNGAGHPTGFRARGQALGQGVIAKDR